MEPTEGTHLSNPYVPPTHRSSNMDAIPQEEFIDDDSASSSSTASSEEDLDMSIAELLYSSSSFHAIVKPVTLTMILAALAVKYINNEQTIQTGEQQLAKAYTVWSVDETDGISKTLAISLANGLVMVSVVCMMTFGIVLLYKYRCMKLLIGYMIFSSATLLGLLGGELFYTAIEIYSLPIDVVTFFFTVYNFGCVGVLAIFWSTGIPTYITQGYLICTSVILAWQVAHFDEWTTWTLLFMLAIYDLCAVLTPCGPLKALVNLMSQDEAPEMPGLLYEAELPPETQRPGVAVRSNIRSAPAPSPAPGSTTHNTATEDHTQETTTGAATVATPAFSRSTSSVASVTVPSEADVTAAAPDNPQQEQEVIVTAELPLAIARVYNLPILSFVTSSTSSRRRGANRGDTSAISTLPLLDGAAVPTIVAALTIPENPTPSELKSGVIVRFPTKGGRIELLSTTRRKKVYLQRDKHGNAKRTLWVDREGKVFSEGMEDDDESDNGNQRNSIRLGLGDFIFYSVLVAKAAMYSFTTFAACMLVILAGLGGTLVLLSVYHHALPALPISIFLAIIFYLVTRNVIEPWVEGVMNNPYYV